eukprot:Protomagalhaensia_sp_Gyna_25__5181@NODE_617_length_3002_cov_111_549106_g478_i0_p1_GENE_NODE_617_length_3002_cov_111_549106_g478_i0NODE_617_length_3002_cov_111_549106_g478_i0_p1_ORF_typecomplete_len385_score59_22UPF0160/PF03690_13/2_8e43_NODE_617_length_3002_cov_111_549106_g478_i04151569
MWLTSQGVVKGILMSSSGYSLSRKSLTQATDSRLESRSSCGLNSPLQLPVDSSFKHETPTVSIAGNNQSPPSSALSQVHFSPCISQKTGEMSLRHLILKALDAEGAYHGVADEPPQYYSQKEEQQKLPLGSVGRLWKSQGPRLLTEKLQIQGDEAKLTAITQKMYEETFLSIDSFENGIKGCECEAPHPMMSILGFKSLVSTYHPDFEGGADFEAEDREAEIQKAKQKAVDLTLEALRDIACRVSEEWYPAISALRKALDNRGDSRILVLDHYIPWQSHLYEFEAQDGLTSDNNIQWVIFQDDRSGQWRASAAAERGDRFKNRALVAPSLRGLRDSELSEKAQFTGLSFVHHTGFTCGADSKAGVWHLITFKDPADDTQNQNSI